MTDYDFHQLSPHDFEKMTRDLLQAEWGVTLESFKTGQDRGIDLRYAKGGANVVVQCKHFLRTGFKGLLRQLRKEASKVRKLKPQRYVLATSVPLSPLNKEEVVEIIGAACLQVGDVLGQDELNNLLSQHSDVEGRHYKLWLASRAVLDRVLNNAVLTHSEFKAQKVYADIRKYVQSNAFPRAVAMLNTERMVILAGPPGVGKTTLANMLLYQHLEKGYKPILIQRDVREGQDLLQKGERQIFYFDDFMGSTYLGERGSLLVRNEDRAILDFIGMVGASPTARLVLTTREHILSQALDQSERMRHSGMGDHRVVLRMADYSLGQKAQILYNHLWCSDLPSAYQQELLKGDFYLEIIRHAKFNPRLIEWLSTYHRVKSVKVAAYQTFVRNLLADPSEIWRHAYERQISDAARSLLLALYTYGGKIGLELLEKAFTALHKSRAERYGFERRPEDFRVALRELIGSFITRVSPEAVQVLDPSVLDLLNTMLREAPANAVDLVLGATSFDQIDRIWSFARTKDNRSVSSALAREADAIAATIGPRLHDDRKVDLGNGNVGYIGASFEHRLAVLVVITSRFRHAGLLSLIAPLAKRLSREWQTESVHIVDGIDVLRAFEASHWSPLTGLTDIPAMMRAALIGEAEKGCRSDEFRELVSVLDLEQDATGEVRTALREGFREYRREHFREELRECRSAEQFDGLLDDLEFIGTALGIDVARDIATATESKTEFETDQEDYGDAMADEWKERYHQDRANERSVRDMFDSLPSDQD